MEVVGAGRVAGAPWCPGKGNWAASEWLTWP